MSANANATEPRQVNVPLVVVGAIVVIATFAAVVLVGQLAGKPSSGAGATQAVLVAGRDVAPRTVLVASDLSVAHYAVADVPPNSLSSASAAVGLVAQTSLKKGQPVLVAGRDVAPRTVLVAADLTVAHYAVADVPPNSLSSASAAVGLVAQTSLKKGQPVLSNQVGKDAGSGALSAYLPLAPGFVALTVPSDEQHGVGGYVQAGDYIDIVAVVTPKGSTSANVRTIYSNIRVIRVGPAAVTAGAASASAQQTGGLATSLTLAVTQCQAEYINWFVANAALRYTLLYYQDYQASTAADANCPRAGSAGGVVEADIRSHWPGLD